MQTLNEIISYLKNFDSDSLNPTITLKLKALKDEAVNNNDEEISKKIWCYEQIYKVINEYLLGYKHAKNKKYFEAWLAFDRSDIEFSFLREHFEYKASFKNLIFIENKIPLIQKLYPYKYFSSRETIVKKTRCSICRKIKTLRNSCSHIVGQIYQGEMCSTIVEEMEFGAIAIVKNPFDKFGVLQFDGMDYDYSDVGMLFSKLNSPFQYWKLEEETNIREEFKNIERNDICPCGSNKKYKKCCMNSDARLSKHMKVQVLYS